MYKSTTKIPVLQGYASPDFKHVMDVFNESFSRGTDKGASVAIYYKGSLVVHLWGGLSDEEAKRPWKEDTLGYLYSVSKFFATLVIADLVEKGVLNYEDKISKYWPDFSQNGKEDITLEMLLSHRAGLSLIDGAFELGWLRDDPRRLTEALVKQRPLWKPGEEVGYSPNIVGLYLSEIVKRVDAKKRDVSQYFRDEFALPFGLDIHIGSPKSLHHRLPRQSWPDAKEKFRKMMSNFPGDIELYKSTFSQPRDWNSRNKLNDPDFAALPSPASHGVGTVKSVAKLAGIISNGGQCDGKTLLKLGTIDRLKKPLAHGLDFITGANSIYGPGPMIIPAWQGGKTWNLFGHSGVGGQMLLCDTSKNFGLAYCTNYMNPFATFDDNGWRRLVEAAHVCIQRIEGNPEKVRLYGSYSEFLKDTTSKL